MLAIALSNPFSKGYVQIAGSAFCCCFFFFFFSKSMLSLPHSSFVELGEQLIPLKISCGVTDSVIANVMWMIKS